MKELPDLVGKDDKETIRNMYAFIKVILADHQKTLSDYKKEVKKNMECVDAYEELKANLKK